MAHSNIGGGADPYRLRTARSSDAPAVFALKTQAFGNRYLLYTIYQAPQSVHYLAHLIAEAEGNGSHDFVVAEDGENVRGYYHATHHGLRYFLNYIAIANESRHHGLGGALLQHFEASGLAKGCHELALDVFESNPPVLDWYGRHGYSRVSSTFHVRLDMNALTGVGAPLHWNETTWSEALKVERTWGFSKIDCDCGSGFLTLGLIGGQTCKLLACQGVSLHEAVLVVALHLRDQRQMIIVSGLTELPSGLPMLSVERAIRLAKVIG